MMSAAVVFMHDISPAWDESLVALLLNKKLFHPRDDEPETGTVKVCFFCSQQQHRHQEEEQVGGGVENKGKNSTSATRIAKIQFASQRVLEIIVLSYQGLVVPLTHGYHYFLFTSSLSISDHDNDLIQNKNINNNNNNNNDMKKMFEFPSPPLHLQLMSLTTEELERRTKLLLPAESSDNSKNGQQHHADTTTTTKIGKERKHQKSRQRRNRRRQRPTLAQHAHLAFLLCKYFDGTRPIQTCLGIPVQEKVRSELLRLLRSIPSRIITNQCDKTTINDNNHNDSNNNNNLEGHHKGHNLKATTALSNQFAWPPMIKQRKGVKSKHYLTLRQKHAPCWDELWNACRQVMVQVYGGTNIPSYNALAITKNFHGSPHVDKHDQTFQHVIALGDFVGGYLCSELNEDREKVEGGGGGETELQINIHNRLGRIDGRMIHWVSQWTGSERYSVVYYSTDPNVMLISCRSSINKKQQRTNKQQKRDSSSLTSKQIE